MHKRIRRGFTLIELLVVIAIIAILIALLLPAVQQAREAARRSTCKNNMHNIGLALHNYHEIHGTFPPAALYWRRPEVDTNRESCGRYGPSWMVMILPMMERGNVYKSWRFDRNAANGANRNARSTFIESYVCPSDVNASTSNPWNRCGGRWARSSYAANGGRQTGGGRMYDWRWSRLEANRKGLMGNSGAAKFRDVTDGTANSVSVWEIVAGPNGNDARGTWAVGRGGVATTGGCDRQGDCGTINHASDAGGWHSDDVHTCKQANVNTDRLMSCWAGGDGQHGPKSFHVGGCHACMADGSVRFVSENIHYNIHRKINGISDGEVLGEF